MGNINFTNIVFGAFQACHLGFSIDWAFEGQGLMREVLAKAMEYMQHHYGLHRIMANYLPANLRSQNVLHNLGFVREGYARSYLKINGKWQDHVLTSYIFDD